jgi:hypothetical protein
VTAPGASRTSRAGLACALSAGALFTAFAGSFGLHRYFDDWMFPINAAQAAANGGVSAFIRSPVGHHWSPLWNALEVLNVRIAGGESDIAIRLLTVVIGACACWWFWRVAGALRLSAKAAMLGIAVLVLHHVNAAAVYSFDTYSQVIADFATWIVAGRLLVIVATDERRLHALEAAALAAATAVALLVKEQALAATASVLWLAVVAVARSPEHRKIFSTLCVWIVAIAATFAFMRRAAGIPFSSTGAFRLCVACAPRNIATLLGLLVLPVRSVAIYDALRDVSSVSARLLVAAAACTSVMLVAVLGGALARADTPPTRLRQIAIGGLLIASCFPTAVLAHVGELYAHTAVFWFALLCAEAFDVWSATTRRRGWVEAGSLAYALLLAIGLRLNLADMRANGERAERWLREYANAIGGLPDGAVVLVHGRVPHRNAADFGLYRLTNPEYLMLELPTVLEERAGRHVRVVPEWNAGAQDPGWALTEGPIYDAWRHGDDITVARRAPR